MRVTWYLFSVGWLAIWTLPFSGRAQVTVEPDAGVSAPSTGPVKEPDAGVISISQDSPGSIDAGSAIVEPFPQEKKRQWYFEGFASEEYRFRHSSGAALSRIADPEEILPQENIGSEMDHDLRLFLSGYLWEDRDHFAADLTMGAWVDLNGTSSVGNPTAVGAVEDYTAPHGWHDPYDIYSLYGEYHSDGVLALARGGRQTSEYGRPTTFDGASLKLRALKPYLDFVVFGGRTVHFFELNDSLFENWIASAVSIIRPIQFLRIELDYRFGVEETATKNEIVNHSYGLAAWYMINDWARVKGYVRGLDNAVSHAGLWPRFEWIDLELGVEAGVDAQLITLGEVIERADPFFAVLGESLPNVRVHCDVFKDFTTRVGVYSILGGWSGRLLTHDEATPFNRDFGRAYLLFQATDIVVSGPFASVIGEYHYTHSVSELATDTFFSGGGSAGYEWKQLKGEVGTYYYRYKYEYYVDVKELADVRTYFGEFRYDPLKWLSVRLRYEYDQMDRDIHTLTLKLTQTY